MKNKIIISGVVIILVGVFFTFQKIREEKKTVPQSENIPTIVATFYPLAHFAQQVVGKQVEVITLIPTGAEPHDYELSPQDLVKIQKADVFIYNGQQLEPWAQEIATELRGKGKTVIEASAEVGDLISVEDIGHTHEGETEEIHGEFDPHVWVDPVRAKQIVSAIENKMIQQYPLSQDEYKKNAELYKTQLDDLDKQFNESLQSCSVREIIASHDAFEYLAKHYNFVVNPITGISPESEPSAFVLSNLADHAKSKNIKVIFFETLVSPKVAEILAKEIGAKTDVLNPVEGITDEERQKGETYISIMQKNLLSLQQAMVCQ